MKYVIWFILAGFIVGGAIVLLPGKTSNNGQLDPRYLSSAKSQFQMYQTKIKMDYSTGPCLGTLPLDDDWVIDIAHNPRQAIDDEPANQCAAYREGNARHFIELDPSGNLIQYK